jgi:hypothetical protein
MNDHFLRIWAESKADDWATEAEHGKRARLAARPRTRISRPRLSLGRLSHLLQHRLHRRQTPL